MGAPPKQIISQKNLYMGINVSVYGKCLVVNIRSMTKKKFCDKNPFSKTTVPNKTFLGLVQAPNMSKYISRNRGATIKASRKTAHDKVFLIFDQKGHFFPKNGCTIPKML